MNTEKNKEKEQRVSTRKYIGKCIVCGSSLVGVNHSISYCSDICKANWELKRSFKSVITKTTALKNEKNCTRCGASLCKKRKSTKAFKRGLCRKHCDGSLRNKGGIPLDPKLRAKYLADRKRNKAIRLQLSKTSFYESREWRELRYKAIKLYNRKCMSCLATDKPIHVDHIKPRSKYPELELQLSNLQILCKDCNLGKSNKDETDWR